MVGERTRSGGEGVHAGEKRKEREDEDEEDEDGEVIPSPEKKVKRDLGNNRKR